MKAMSNNQLIYFLATIVFVGTLFSFALLSQSKSKVATTKTTKVYYTHDCKKEASTLIFEDLVPISNSAYNYKVARRNYNLLFQIHDDYLSDNTRLRVWELNDGASTPGYKVEVLKNGNLIYSSMCAYHYAISSDRNFLVVTESEKGTYIYDIENNKINNFSETCATNRYSWSNNYLVGHSTPTEEEHGSGDPFNTEFCVWNTRGKLLSKIELPDIYFGAASSYFMYGEAGVADNGKSLYVCNGAPVSEFGDLTLVDMNSLKQKKVSFAWNDGDDCIDDTLMYKSNFSNVVSNLRKSGYKVED